MKKLEFGIGSSDPKRSWGDTIALVQRAEKLGFDSMCMWDHPNFPGVDAHTGLAALAASTSRIRLWGSVFVVPFRAPSIFARALASLDVVSNGRLIVGLGTGWDQAEFQAYGIPFQKKSARNAALKDAIHILRAMWTQERATYHGETWSVQDAICEPKPVQKPGPPIWVGTHGGLTAIREIVIPLADGWNLGVPSHERAPAVEDVLRSFRETSEAMGRDPDSLTTTINLLVQGKEEGSSLRAMYSGHLSPQKFLTLEDTQQIVDRIGALAKLGVSHFMLGIRSRDIDNDLSVLAEKVLPAFR